MEIGGVIALPTARTGSPPRPRARGESGAGSGIAAAPAQGAGAQAPVERVVQGELLQHHGHPSLFLHTLRTAAQAADRLGSTAGGPGPQRARRGAAAYRVHQQLFTGGPTAPGVDEYA